MAEKKQVRLTSTGGTVVRVSEDEAKMLGGEWKAEKASAKTE